MTKQETRTQELKDLANLYEEKLGPIIKLNDKFELDRLPIFVKDVVELVIAKTPSFSTLAALNTTNYAMGHTMCQTRAVIDDMVYSSSPIGINYYGISLAKSGKGKSSSTNALIGDTSSAVFHQAIQLVNSKRTAAQMEKAKKIAFAEMAKKDDKIRLEDVNDSDAMEYVKPLTRTMVSGKSSRGGITSVLVALQKEEFSALSISFDELAMTIAHGQTVGEVMELLTESFDMSIAEAPAFKTQELQEESVGGVYINMLAHTSPKMIFSNPQVKAVVELLFASSFARRAWFSFSDEDEALENNRVARTLEEDEEEDNVRRGIVSTKALPISEHMAKSVNRLLEDSNKRKIVFSEDAAILYKRYFRYCDLKAELAVEGSLHQLEVGGRAWRIGKLAGIWATVSGTSVITEDILSSAIYFAEWNVRYLHKFSRMLAAKPHETLYDQFTTTDEHIVSLDSALDRGLLLKTNPSAIAELLEPLNSKLLGIGACTYDASIKMFTYQKFDVVEEKTIEVIEVIDDEEVTVTKVVDASYAMSYSVIEEADRRLHSDAPEELDNKAKSEWVKAPRVKYLNSFLYHNDNLAFEHLIAIMSQDTVYNAFDYKDAEDKDGNLVTRNRNKNNILGATNILVIDVDVSAIPMEAIHDYMENYRHILASTSSVNNSYKFRLILPINSYIKGEDRELYSYIVRRVSAELLLDVDKVSFNPTQPIYGYAGAKVLSNENGKLFNVTEYLTEFATEGAVVKSRPIVKHRTDKARKAHVAKMLDNVDTQFAYALNPPQGEGSYTLARAALHAIDEGVSAEELEMLINYLNNSWPYPLEQGRLERTIILPYSLKCKH